VTAPGLWTAQDVADFLGLASTGSARRTLSRWGVKAVDYKPGENGRTEARYSSEQVRSAASSRPGRGTRTDLANN